MTYSGRFLLVPILVAIKLIFPFAAVAATAAVEIADLGQAAAGVVDVFRVDVRNPACADPQDFRFVPTNLPWLKFTHGDKLEGVAHGQTRTFAAEIDLSGLKPGRYSGRLDIVCETCGQFVLSLCDIDKRQVIVQVQVVASVPERK